MTVSPRYFEVLKIPLVRGRLFTDDDRLDAPAVAVISQAMARQFWPGSDPLNERLVIGRGLGQNFEEPVRQVVGIVGDVHDDALGLDPLPAVYVPLAQRPNARATGMFAVVRTCGQSRDADRALGAQARDVRHMVLFHGMRLTLIGVAIGMAAAFSLTRFLASFLFGVQALDSVVFILVPIFLSVVALAAVWLPALRASRVDPLTALRYE